MVAPKDIVSNVCLKITKLLEIVCCAEEHADEKCTPITHCLVRMDKEEVERLALYKTIQGKEKIAIIDEKLLEYWK